MGKFDGIEPMCYSRNVEFAGLLVFQPGNKKKKDFIVVANYFQKKKQL